MLYYRTSRVIEANKKQTNKHAHNYIYSGSRSMRELCPPPATAEFHLDDELTTNIATEIKPLNTNYQHHNSWVAILSLDFVTKFFYLFQTALGRFFSRSFSSSH